MLQRLTILLLICVAGPAFGQSKTGQMVPCENGKADQFPCSNVNLLSLLVSEDIGGGYVNDSWGWTDPETGKEYAIIGRAEGTSFVDVTDPINPVYIGELPLHPGARANFWRDVKVYANHVFVVADGAGQHGMQIFDLTLLRAITNPPATLAETGHYDGIASAHNLAINEETGFAYILGASGGGDTCGGGLHMVNIQDPLSPTFAGCFSSDGYTHDAQCVVYQGPDTEHRGKEVCIGANASFVSIADVTDKAAPVALAAGTYPLTGYTHQGWLTPDHRYYYMNDEADESNFGINTRTVIWDVMDLDDPVVAAEYSADVPAIDHNLYVVGNRMYQANYNSGFRLLDISDPLAPQPIGFFDTEPSTDRAGFGGAWNVYPFFESGTLIVTGGLGLFVVQQPQTQVANEATDLPNTGFALDAAYPNPFRGATTIGFTLETPAHVAVRVFNTLGVEVATLADGLRAEGTHTVNWNAAGLPSGTYFYRLEANGHAETHRVVVLGG